MSANESCYTIDQMENLLEKERKGCLKDEMAVLFYTHLGQCPACQQQAYELNRLEMLLQNWGTTLKRSQRPLLSVLHISVQENTLLLKSMGQALKEWSSHSAPRLNLAPVVLRGEEKNIPSAELLGVSESGDRSVSITSHQNTLRIRLEGFDEKDLPEIYLQPVSSQSPPQKLAVSFMTIGDKKDQTWEALVTNLPPGDHLLFLEELHKS